MLFKTPIVPFSDCTKIIYDIVYFLPDLFPPFLSPSGLRSNIAGNRFKIPFARTSQYKNYFICIVTQLWNNLPLEAILIVQILHCLNNLFIIYCFLNIGSHYL